MITPTSDVLTALSGLQSSHQFTTIVEWVKESRALAVTTVLHCDTDRLLSAREELKVLTEMLDHIEHAQDQLNDMATI